MHRDMIKIQDGVAIVEKLNSNLISISKFNIDAFDMINISSHNNR